MQPTNEDLGQAGCGRPPGRPLLKDWKKEGNTKKPSRNKKDEKVKSSLKFG